MTPPLVMLSLATGDAERTTAQLQRMLGPALDATAGRDGVAPFLYPDVFGDGSMVMVRFALEPLSAAAALAMLEQVDFTVASFESLYDAWYERTPRYICPGGFSDGHYGLGWACAFRGWIGHERLVSRRWLGFGPWLTYRGANDTTLVQFHDLSAGAEDALVQARVGHERMGFSDTGGFIPSDHVFNHDLSGAYLENQCTLRILVSDDREVTQREMLDACVLRHQAQNRAEEPIEHVGFVFTRRDAAERHLHELWLRGLQCWSVEPEGDLRLDEAYRPPPPAPPAWSRSDVETKASVGNVSGETIRVSGKDDEEGLSALVASVQPAAPRPEWPIGATLGKGRWLITELVHGSPERGVFRAHDAHGGTALVTMSVPIRTGYTALGQRLEFDSRAVARLHSIGEISKGELRYDVMVEAEPRGAPLSARKFPLRTEEVVELGRQLAAILHETSEHGQVLRGLRPETIYVANEPGIEVTQVVPRGETFIADAKPVSQGLTHCYDQLYLAPEVMRDAPEPASDVFSLCAVLAHAASGEHPFEGTFFAQLESIMTGRRPPFRGSPALAALIDRGLALDPGARPTPAEILATLGGLRSGA